MEYEIEGHICQMFIDYDRLFLATASLDARIKWLEERLNVILIRPLDEIFKHGTPHHNGAPHHDKVNKDNMSFFLGGITLIACSIEALRRFFNWRIRKW